MNPPTTSIDDLPPEMIRELFHYLRLKDLAACSLVNKCWHSIYAAFKLHSLAITDYEKTIFDVFNAKKWYHSKRPFREAERGVPAIFGRLVEKPLLSNLRQLAICGYWFHYNFDFNVLNRFEKLVHLEIRISLREMKVHLNLPKLKVLAFHVNEHCLLFVDCPELSTLLYQGDANLLDVKHPETIRKLETDLVGSDLVKFKKKFKNVECLVTKRPEAISKATLLALPRLRELRYNRDIENLVGFDFRRGSMVATIDRMKRTLNEFLREAKRLKGSDFRFTFAGFQLTNVKLEQIDFGVQSGREWVYNEYVYMKNYHLIEPGAINFLQNVNYGSLLRNATGELPRCFSQKFTDIRWVLAVDVIEDPDQLLRFLKSLRSLECLELVTAGLGQEFYDRLPASTRSLSELQLHGYQVDVLVLNFEFIGEFSCISCLKIQPPLSLESSTSLANSLPGERSIFVEYDIDPRIHMKEFLIPPLRYGRENHIKIRKDEWSKFWAIDIAGHSASNPKEIVNYFEPLQNPA